MLFGVDGKPLATCPECGEPLVVLNAGKRYPRWLSCPRGHGRLLRPDPQRVAACRLNNLVVRCNRPEAFAGLLSRLSSP